MDDGLLMSVCSLFLLPEEEDEVIHQLPCALWDLWMGPRNLIRKRLDKLLSYKVIEGKPNLSYKEQAVANAYRWELVSDGWSCDWCDLLYSPSPPDRMLNTLLLKELPHFNGLALQIRSMFGSFSCLHRDLAADMKQLFHCFAQQVTSLQIG